MSSNEFSQLRVGIIGNCQVVGLRDATKALLPGANVECWHVGVSPPHDPLELAALLRNYDLIISQISDLHKVEALRIGRLNEAGLPIIFLPPILFRGFHPDVIYIRDQTGVIIDGVGSQYQSAIVAAAFSLDLSVKRANTLFNTYVFSELGYLDTFPTEKAAFLANLKSQGYDLKIMFDRIIAEIGQVMYSINHPHIRLLTIMCRIALAKANLIGPETPLPANIPDQLEKNFICPVYQPIAKRLGISGSSVFLRAATGLEAGQTREISLEDYIASSMLLYQKMTASTFDDPPVAKVRDKLKSLIQ